MGIKISFNVKELEDALTKGESDSIANGGLDGDQVWYEYLTQEDDRVRPSHEALHGTLWRVDDSMAPTPPIDWGCRCFIRYVAAPKSLAAKVLPEASGKLSDRIIAYAIYLNSHIDGWEKISSEAAKLRKSAQFEFIVNALRDSEEAVGNEKDVALMILATL